MAEPVPQPASVDPQSLAALHEVLTRLLRHFDAVCADAGATYFLDAGTLVGAVRSGDWIPWDDDIDVVMWREDYEVLRDYLVTHPDPQTHLWDPLREPGSSVLPRFTIRDSSLLVTDVARLGHPERSRVCLDVFVIDTAPPLGWQVSIWLAATRGLQGARFVRGCSWSRIQQWHPPIQAWPLRVAWVLSRLLPDRVVRGLYNRTAMVFTGRSQFGRTINGGRTARRMVMNRQWFARPARLRFAGHDYLGPGPDPDKYLTAMYGPGYLTPPPAHLRVAHEVVAAKAGLDELVLDIGQCP